MSLAGRIPVLSWAMSLVGRIAGSQLSLEDRIEVEAGQRLDEAERVDPLLPLDLDAIAVLGLEPRFPRPRK
jgi:hypothetical protein